MAELSQAMPLMKSLDPDSYKRFRGLPLEAVFIGQNDGSPSWISVTFSVTEPLGIPSISSRTTHCPGQCGNQVFAYGIIGTRSAILGAKKLNPRLLEDGDPETIAASLIEIEIDKEPEYVGRPMSELVLHKNGVRWIYPGACNRSSSQKKTP